MATSVRVLGVRVDAVDTAGAVARIGALVEAGGHHQVATVNPEFIMLARRDPEAGPEGDAGSLALIREARPQILLVGYGHPKQELWIERNRLRAGVPVAMGVGGAFDFVSGRVPRAPAWMRRVGLEWLYRLGREPWRARRMAVLPAFAIRVLLAAGR